MANDQDQKSVSRAAVYIDGFNLYYPIHEMGEPFLKWSNLHELSVNMVRVGGYDLVKCVFCTAVPTDNHGKRDRHNTFNRVQEACGVNVLKGHYVYDDTLGKYSEKQSDMNVGLSLICDGFDDIYDAAYLVSADSDQAATARVFSERFPEKKLFIVAPPDRSPPNKCLPFADGKFTLRKEDIERCVLPQLVTAPATGNPIRRPTEYDPPVGWVHPKQRPVKKKKGRMF